MILLSVAQKVRRKSFLFERFNMSKKLTTQQCFARSEAYQECADHLEMEWTDDPIEREEGVKLIEAFCERAAYWRSEGQKRRNQHVE